MEDWKWLALRRLRNYHAGRDETYFAWPLRSKFRTNGAEGRWPRGRIFFQIHCGMCRVEGMTV